MKPLLLPHLLLLLLAAAPPSSAQSPQESTTPESTTTAAPTPESITTGSTPGDQSTITCKPCALDHDGNTAVKWCTECRLGPGPMHCGIPFSVPCDAAAVDGSDEED
ncbi:hypothetical protein GE09DRAFT_1217650 [Coniochaeta sp. 2T2.1]|nr:hypothetical protein GE09DRAFT_1217650 [Coniochaeta sp. 2T2.1]